MRILFALFALGISVALTGCLTNYSRCAETFINEPKDAVEVRETKNRYTIRSVIFKSYYKVNGKLTEYSSEVPETTKKYQEIAEKLYPKVFAKGGIPVDIEKVYSLGTYDSNFGSASTSHTDSYCVIVNGKRCPVLRQLFASAYANSAKIGEGDDYQRIFSEIQPLSSQHNWRITYFRATWPDGTGIPGSKDPELLPGSYGYGEGEYEEDRPLFAAIARRIKAQENPQAAIRKATVMKPRADYTVEKFAKVKGSTLAYEFKIKYAEGGDISDFKKNQADIRDLVKRDYAEANGADYNDVIVVFPSFNWQGGSLIGRAEVFEIEAPPYVYDSYTRRGSLDVRIVNGDFGKARAWAIKHIESIACSKNILLVTGEAPPKGKYKLLNENVKEDNTLEMEFEVE